MKAELVKKYKTYSEYKIKCNREYIHFYVDNDKCEKVEKIKDLKVLKREVRDINNLESFVSKNRLVCGRNKKSFIRELVNCKQGKNYFLKDTYTNKNENILDYRTHNIVDKITDVHGYSLIPKYNYEKQDKEYFVSCMREKRYNKNYSRELSRTKAGDDNPSTKLSKEMVEKIREERYILGCSQQYLADKYNVGRATISDIVNYRTWVLKNDLSLRIYKDDKILVPEKVDYFFGSCIYDRLKENYLLLDIAEERVYIYLEKLPIDRLLYMEIRNRNNEFIISSDLFFPIDNKRTDFILASFNPIKTGRLVSYKYKDILDCYKF